MIDHGAIDRRIKELEAMRQSSKYEGQKNSLKNTFEAFLQSTSPQKDYMSASPYDVRRFLIWKDKGGKTQVHDIACNNKGTPGVRGCECPVGVL